MMGSLLGSSSSSNSASWAWLLPPEAAPAAGVEKRRAAAAAEGKGAAAAAAMQPEAPRDLRALLARAGGRAPLLLAGEARPAELESFARDLLAEPPPPPPEELEEESPEAAGWRQRQRRARLRGGGGWLPPWRGCALLLALFRAASLEPPGWARERRRLREILRDLRARLPSAPPPAVVGVVLLLPPPEEEASSEEEEAARLQLEALLREVFRRGGRRPPSAGLPDTLQAVTYRPGEAQAAREAACRALRAALKLRADGAEIPRRKLPAAFSWCLPWGGRNEDLHPAAKLNEDALQDLEGAIALTNIAANGKCEEASEGLDT